MKSWMKLTVLITIPLLCAIIASGCIAYQEDANAIANIRAQQSHANTTWVDDNVFSDVSFNPTLEKIHIEEDNVDCYVLWSGSGSSISCVNGGV